MGRAQLVCGGRTLGDAGGRWENLLVSAGQHEDMSEPFTRLIRKSFWIVV